MSSGLEFFKTCRWEGDMDNCPYFDEMPEILYYLPEKEDGEPMQALLPKHFEEAAKFCERCDKYEKANDKSRKGRYSDHF